MNEQNKFDGILMTIIQQKGNIQGFFDSVFGFLRRSTDFFADQKKAQEIIVSSCKANFEKYTSEKQSKEQEQEKKRKQNERKKKLKQQQQILKKQENMKKEQKMNEQKLTQNNSNGINEKNKTQQQQQKTEQEKQGKNDEDDKQPAPKGNGGQTEKYLWIQTLQNLEMFIYLQKGIVSKNLKVVIAFDKMSIHLKGQLFLQGKWKGKINTQQSFWTIQDGELDDGYKGRYIHVNVQKWKNQTSWWSSPLQGHEQINTQKINPEPSKLSDLDGETRSTVEKMMFDMRQKQQGLPSSDQLQKQDKMKDFMKAHPQLDFSKCKFG